MLINEIKELAKKEKVNVLFDMDGTLVEYLPDGSDRRNVPGSDFYTFNRPLNYMIKVAKRISKIKNVEVHILSNCPLNEQIEQKINWLKKYAPFINLKNVNIICYENITYNKDEKRFLKGNLIKEKFPNQKCFLIEDDLRNIKAVNSLFGGEVVAYHISSLIK